MRSFDSRKAIHGRVQARQHIPPRQDTSFSLYFVTDDAMTMTAPGNPLPTGLIFDTAAGVQTFDMPTGIAQVTSTLSSSPAVKTVESATSLSSATPTSTSLDATATAVIVLDPAQKVYDGIANMALHSLPPAVIGIASGGSALVVLLALYCFICRWYYRRLPRSTRRWDIDDRAKKEVLYDDKPRYSPEDEAAKLPDDSRRGVPVGDSYFPEGETWKKFEGRTAQHPESFIYTGPGLPEGMGPHSPNSPSSGTSLQDIPLARPRPKFVQNGKRGQIESVFSNVSFPTTHRADSMRHSYFPEGYEHDGEVWDLASPGLGNDGGPRPSFDSSQRSINRASIFGEASARARGSVVVYESQPSGPLRSPGIVEDPFAGPNERGNVHVLGADRFAGKKSFDSHHIRNMSRDVRPLDTLAEDMDESSSQGHGTVSSKYSRAL